MQRRRQQKGNSAQMHAFFFASAGQDDAKAALDAAASVCARRGVAFTRMRRALLAAIWEARRPIGAYELVEALQRSLGRKLTPTTVYRTLDFLLEQGLVIRIESRNAYLPCAHPDRPRSRAFFVCDECNASIALDDPRMESLLTREAGAIGFTVRRKVLELQGVCSRCLGAR
jgi:Fur family transcriptional regulator, zinc uptake regulator